MARQDQQPWRLGPRGERWFDLALVGSLLLPVPVLLYHDGVTVGLLMVAQILPLAWRRRWPVPAFAVIAFASAVQAVLLHQPLWSQIAFPVATYSVARFSTTAWSLSAATVSLGGAVVASVVWLRGFGSDVLTPANFAAYFLSIATFVVAAWALGTLGRTRQAYVDALVERGERLQRESVQQAALAAVEERHRIAREMHDVVAHGLTTIVVQADGARAAAVHDPSVTAPAFETIAATGREAIAEMRRMLGLLRAEGPVTAPQPRLTDLPALIDEARAAGTPVRTDLPEPLPAVSDGVALTAYRVVQESLSNVRKHAGPGATADVRLATDQGLVVEVVDDGRGAAAPHDGRGLGLTGMHERVAAHGGEITVGPRPGGGFAVCARIPL